MIEYDIFKWVVKVNCCLGQWGDDVHMATSLKRKKGCFNRGCKDQAPLGPLLSSGY